MKIKFWGYVGEKTPDNEEVGVLGRRYKKECYPRLRDNKIVSRRK